MLPQGIIHTWIHIDISNGLPVAALLKKGWKNSKAKYRSATKSNRFLRLKLVTAENLVVQLQKLRKLRRVFLFFYT